MWFIQTLPAATASHEPEATFPTHVGGLNTAGDVSGSIRPDSSLLWVHRAAPNVSCIFLCVRALFLNILPSRARAASTSVWVLMYLFISCCASVPEAQVSFSQINTFSCISPSGPAYSVCVRAPSQGSAVKTSNVTWSYTSDKFDKQPSVFLSLPPALAAGWQHLPFSGRSSVTVLSAGVRFRARRADTTCTLQLSASAFSPCMCSGCVSHHCRLTTSLFHRRLESRRHLQLHTSVSREPSGASVDRLWWISGAKLIPRGHCKAQ